MQIQNKFIERGYETSAIALCLRWFPIGSWKGGGISNVFEDTQMWRSCWNFGLSL